MISNSYFEVVAIKDHKPVHQSQLAFKKGQKFIVVETAPTGWWRGECNGKSGLFPQSYVNKVETEENITESPELSSINNSNVGVSSQQNQQFSPPPSSLLPPPPLTSLISVTNLNINDIKIEEFINNLPPPPTENNTNNIVNTKPIIPITQPKERVLPPPINNTNTLTPPSQPTPSQPKSPRFNVTGIQNSVQQQPFGVRPVSPVVKNNTPGNTSPPNIYNTISGTRSSTTSNNHYNHSRKNSGPSTSVDEASDELENETKTIIKPQPISSNTNSNQNADKFKTLPSNITKTRTPIITSDRIGMKDINPDIPYYIVRAMSNHTKQAFDELEVVQGDLIVVYNHKDIKSDWWVGKIKSNFGIFPMKCVEIIKDISPNPSVLSPPLSSQTALKQQQQTPIIQPPPTLPISKPTPTAEPTYRKGIAMATYNSQFANYLSFKKGDEIVLVKKEGEFWKGRIGNQIGLVSANYISEVQLPNSIPQSKTPIPNNTTHQPESQPIKTPISNTTAPQAPTPITKPQPTNSVNNTTPNGNSTTELSEEESVAQKIKDSMSQFETREELLTAIQNLAIKFVRQTAALKKELIDEKNNNQKLENEIKLLESELDLLKSLQQ